MTEDLPPPPSATIAEGKAWLLAHVDDGAACPLCTQFAKVYRRSITSGMARNLIGLYRAEGRAWAHITTVMLAEKMHPGDFAKVRYWGLLEKDEGRREDGARHNGWWRITAEGEAYVRGVHSVPRWARIYDSRCLELVGPLVDIKHALRNRFDYWALMHGDGDEAAA